MNNKTAQRFKRFKKHDLSSDSSPLIKKAKLLVVVLASLSGLLVLVQIYFSGKVAVTGERIKQLELEKSRLVLENAKLQDKINKLSSLSYIEEKARKELQMIEGVSEVWYLSVREALARR